MANDSATIEQKDNLEGLDFDELEKQLQETLESELSDLDFIDEQSSQIGNPDALGDVILNVVWEQFTNQIAIQAGEDFVKANNGLRLDLSDEAHIQTTENFAKGKISSHNTEIDYQQRYNDWQADFQKNEDGSVKTKTDPRTGKEKAVLTTEARKDFDKDRPKGSKTVNKDHTIAAAEIIRDPEAAAHMTREEKIAFANSEKNLVDLDAAANQSKGDSTMTDWLDSERNGEKPADRFPIDEEELRQRDQEAREEYEIQKAEAEKKSIESGKKSQKAEAFRIGKKAVRAVVMNLLTGLVKKIIQKLVAWLKSKEKNLKSLLTFIKNAIIEFVLDLKKNVLNVADTVITVIATSILGPVIGTIKKAWMFIKQGWASLKQSIEHIRNPQNKNKPIGILMMEVGKIVMAGLTAAGAIVLGEVIEKGLMAIPIFSIEIPFFGSLANIIGIFLGAIISGIIGALAINLINRLIAEKQKRQFNMDRVDKGNEVLHTQNVMIAVKKQKLAITKEQAVTEIKERHEIASHEMRKSIEKIFDNDGEKNDDDFDQMNRTLNSLMD